MHPELFTIPGINLTVPGYGAMMLLGFLLATWWTVRRAMRVKADPDIILNLGFIILFFCLLGSRAFYVIHYWDEQFAHQPAQIINLRAGGFEFYGGLVGAFIPAVLYLWYKGLSIRLYADLVTPAILLGLGIGRIGCFLFGCCWGGACSADLPWAVHFPYGSPAHTRQWENRQVTLPAELILIDPAGTGGPMPRAVLNLTESDMAGLDKKVDEATQALEQAEAGGDAGQIKRARAAHARIQLGIQTLTGHFDRFDVAPASLARLAAGPAFTSQPVHPAQLYAAAGAILLAWLTSAYFYRRKRHGAVMALGMMLYSVLRIVEEIIRVDNPRDTLGLTVSQGVSLVIFVAALAALIILRRMPLRSPAPARVGAAGAPGPVQETSPAESG